MGAYVGQDLKPEVMSKIAKEGARTVPGREHGGNCDVRSFSESNEQLNLSADFHADLQDQKFVPVRLATGYFRPRSHLCYRGSRCYFPVFVKGANLSVGDLHFSQGDVSYVFFSKILQHIKIDDFLQSG